MVSFKNQSFLKLLDFTPEEINQLLDLSAELKAQQAMFSPDGDSIRLILTSADTLGNNDANNTGWEDLGITPKMHAINIFNRPADGNAIGQGQLFTLADGSFILVDGGHQTYDAEQVYRAMKYLNERPDGKIVIAAWILTHDHRDQRGLSGCLAGTIRLVCAQLAGDIGQEADAQRGDGAVDQPVDGGGSANGSSRMGAKTAYHGRVNILHGGLKNLFKQVNQQLNT